MPPTDAISQLRAELETLHGEARVGPLVQLGQALANRYWHTGPGSPAALPDLNGVIDSLSEAHRLIDPADGIRGPVSALLGINYAARYTAHGTAVSDREDGLTVLKEVGGYTGVPPMLRSTARLFEGQLHLGRATAGLQSPGLAMAAISGGGALEGADDAEQAVVIFRELLAEPEISEEITESAKLMLTLAESLQPMLGGFANGLANLDFGRLMESMATMQKMQAQFKDRGTGFMPGASLMSQMPLFNAGILTGLDPLDRPIAVLHGPRAAGDDQAVRIQPAAPITIDRDALRASLRTMLSASGAAEEEPSWALAGALLRADAPAPAADELVALASMTVDGQDDTDAVTAALDAYVLAVSLLLRARQDDAYGDDDRLDGAKSLLAAARAIPAGHAAAMTVYRSLGAFLEPPRLLNAALALDFADHFDEVISSGTVTDGADLATLHALRSVCRAAEMLADVRRAVGTVPLDYPWLDRLRAAAGMPEPGR